MDRVGVGTRFPIGMIPQLSAGRDSMPERLFPVREFAMLILTVRGVALTGYFISAGSGVTPQNVRPITRCVMRGAGTLCIGRQVRGHH